MTYFLSYGFLSGKLNGARMRKLMEKKGYKLTEKSEEADIILAHSAGCWDLPADIKAKIVIYVGLPLTPPGFAASTKNNRAVNRNLIHDRALKAALRYYSLAFFYALAQPRRNLGIVKNASSSMFKDYKNCKMIMVRNKDDEWVNPPDMKVFAEQHKTWSFISLPGSHDNIWQKPEKYVEIINAFATTKVSV